MEDELIDILKKLAIGILSKLAFSEIKNRMDQWHTKKKKAESNPLDSQRPIS